MPITMHSASVPMFVRLLGNLSGWLDAAEAHAAANRQDAAVYLAARLAPDMLPFAKQVQIACDTAKFTVARLAPFEAPKFADDEASLADLRDRIAKTIEFLRSVPASAVDGTEDREVNVPVRGGTMAYKGESYLTHFALPNFFFHVTTAYALLRHAGVPLGKRDFLGAP